MVLSPPSIKSSWVHYVQGLVTAEEEIELLLKFRIRLFV